MTDHSRSYINQRRETLSRYQTARKIIPGATQLLSKRAEMFAPEQWPPYYAEASGVTVTDIDGNEYVDMSLMGVGACVLGYADPDVDEAASQAIDHGVMSSLNPPEEVELAEKLINMHDWADMVRFGRPGGEAMAIAVRLARAYTGDETVAFCGYHGWHDWYLAANLETEENLDGHLLPGLNPAGVPKSLQGTSKPFEFNDIETLQAIANENELAAIVMEPIRYEEPEDGFWEGIEKIVEQVDAQLIIDEITSGFRVRPGGYHQNLGIEPDIAVYGKALGNGYPISAVVGQEHVMDEAQNSFISSTFWTERIGPRAALATLEKFDEYSVSDHLVNIGEQITNGWHDIAADRNLNIKTKGLKPLATFEIKHEDSQAIKTLFIQEMLNRGYLASDSVYTSFAHRESIVDEYLEAVDVVFKELRDAIEEGEIRDRLEGPVAHSKFERLN